MKPENAFIQSVHNYIDKNIVYYEKTNNPYNSGTPDVYYEGNKQVIWIEYKYVRKFPKRYKIKLSELQRKWLKRAYDNSQHVYVVTGSPEGAHIHRYGDWNISGTIVLMDHSYIYNRRGLAEWIVKICSQ